MDRIDIDDKSDKAPFMAPVLAHDSRLNESLVVDLIKTKKGDEITIEFLPSRSYPQVEPMRIDVVEPAKNDRSMVGLAVGGPENWDKPVKVFVTGSTFGAGSSARPLKLEPNLWPEIMYIDSELAEKQKSDIEKLGKENYQRNLKVWGERLGLKRMQLPQIAEVYKSEPIPAERSIFSRKK